MKIKGSLNKAESFTLIENNQDLVEKEICWGD